MGPNWKVADQRRRPSGAAVSARKMGVTSLIVISLLQFGQISTVGTTEHAGLVLMTFPFARRNVGASEKAHPGVGACQSEKQESEIGRVAMRQRLYPEHCAPIIRKRRGKMSAAVRRYHSAVQRISARRTRARRARSLDRRVFPRRGVSSPNPGRGPLLSAFTSRDREMGSRD
jgi:hypothetical protein